MIITQSQLDKNKYSIYVYAIFKLNSEYVAYSFIYLFFKIPCISALWIGLILQ